MKRIAVFCGSRHGTDDVYGQAARELGQALLKRSLGLVYGGGNVGLMGVIADTVMGGIGAGGIGAGGGGEVVGVITERLKTREVAHQGLTELHVMETMHERKELMYRLSDAVIALPGGIGTFDELFEALTWNQLGIHRIPCGLFNVEGYYDPLVAMMERAGEKGFVVGPERLLAVADNAEDLLDELDARASL